MFSLICFFLFSLSKLKKNQRNEKKNNKKINEQNTLKVERLLKYNKVQRKTKQYRFRGSQNLQPVKKPRIYGSLFSDIFRETHTCIILMHLFNTTQIL